MLSSTKSRLAGKNLSLLFIAFLFLQYTSLAQDGWVQQTSGTIADLESVNFYDANNGWAVGESGTILNTTDGGNIWNVQLSPTTDDLRSVQFVDTSNGWSTGWGSGGKLLRTNDGGQNWTDISDTLSIVCSYFIDNNTGWACTKRYEGNDHILKTTNGGQEWISQYEQYFGVFGGGFRLIYFNDPSTGWAIIGGGIGGWTSGLLRTNDAGENWEEIIPFDPWGVSSICFLDSITGWIVTSNSAPSPGGVIYRTSDGGYSWQLQFDGFRSNWFSSICLINIDTGWATGRDDDEYGFILYTSNSGNEWIEQDCGNVAPINSIHFTDENNGWAVGDSGLILHTTTGGLVSVEEEQNNGVPTEYNLTQNYPNPFNPSTTIKYSIPQSSNVVIKVFDVLGNEIETLVNEEKPVGTYELTWNAPNLPSGVYFYQLRAGSFVETKKMVLIK
ncbi:MAG: YCF48-related protein [Ignavibacteria bacterium]|nr:YCF48-related protein [Ignavibacteria bacterium]